MEPKPQKRIVVLESNRLLFAGVRSFLSTQEWYDVIGLNLVDQEQIHQAIERLQPDVIILDNQNRVTDLSALMSYLEGLSKIRVIIVNVTDNQIQICEKQQLRIHQLSDFLAAL